MTQPEKSYSWTQPCCHDCWDAGNPESPSPRTDRGELETCVYCAMPTHSGIYVRVDPKLASYPSLER
jgi:hypothetical protein